MRHSTKIAALAIIAIFLLAGCGDDTPTTPTPPPAPVVPSASIDAEGFGNLAIHPSADPGHLFAFEFPLQLTESSGGTAIWNYMRGSLFLNGVEIERHEIGATEIRAAGFRDVAANSTTRVRGYLRFNRTDFDDIALLLGFIDKKDSRRFEESVDFSSFDGVVVDPTPAAIPDGSR